LDAIARGGAVREPTSEEMIAGIEAAMYKFLKEWRESDKFEYDIERQLKYAILRGTEHATKRHLEEQERLKKWK
jgi:hypothetical protein